MIQVRFGRQKIEVDEGLGISHVDGILYVNTYFVNIKFTTKILPKVFNLRYTTNAIYSSNILCLPSASIQQKRHLIKYAFFIFISHFLYIRHRCLMHWKQMIKYNVKDIAFVKYLLHFVFIMIVFAFAVLSAELLHC